MERILVINPNSSVSCTQGIAAALAPFGGTPGMPRFEVTCLPEGPAAITTWRDWYSVAEPLCRMVEREPAAAYVIACVSDPGLEAVRMATAKPVLSLMRCAIAAALARGERFGMIGFMETSRPRQRRVLQAMGVEDRLAGYHPLNLPMEVLTDPQAPRARIQAVAKQLVAEGADVVVLGCAGMAGHVQAAQDACGVPVIEPCQAAGVQALLAAVGGRTGLAAVAA